MDEPQKPEVKGGGNPPAATRTLPPTLNGMTRKTKVGLAVGASFLTLVGGVFGIKQFGKPAAEPAREAVAVTQNTHAAPAEPAAAPGGQDKPAPPAEDPFNPAPRPAPRPPAGFDPSAEPTDPSMAAGPNRKQAPADPFAVRPASADTVPPPAPERSPARDSGAGVPELKLPVPPEPRLGAGNDPRGSAITPATHNEVRPQEKDPAGGVAFQLPPVNGAPNNPPPLPDAHKGESGIPAPDKQSGLILPGTDPAKESGVPKPDPVKDPKTAVPPAPDRQTDLTMPATDPIKDPAGPKPDPFKDPAAKDPLKDPKAVAAAPRPGEPGQGAGGPPPIDAVPLAPSPAPVGATKTDPPRLEMPPPNEIGGQGPKREEAGGAVKPTRPTLTLTPGKKKEDDLPGAIQPVNGSDLLAPPPAPPAGPKKEVDGPKVNGPEGRKDERIPKLDLPLDPPAPGPISPPVPAPVPSPHDAVPPAPQPRQDLTPMTPLAPAPVAPSPVATPKAPTLELGPIKTPEPKVDNAPKPADPRPAAVADGGPKPADKPEGGANTGRPLPPAAVAHDGGYDEDLHRASANDNFRTISRHYYEDESYAAALEQYNRDNPGGAGYVRVPPIEVLLKRYPKAMPKDSSRASSGVAPASLALQGDSAPAAPARDYPVYTVPDNGETLRDIAQKTLGNGDAWHSIHDLNGSVNPAEKVPGGTRLRLPPQARLQ